MSIEQRLRRSAELIASRQREAQSLTLLQKAMHFEELAKKFSLLPDHALVAKHRRAGRSLTGDLETTTYLLAAVALQYAVTRNRETEAWGADIVESLRALDEINRLDGYLAEGAVIETGRLVSTDNETHSNAYSQLFLAYLVAHEHFHNSHLKAAIRDHVTLIADHFLDHELVLRDHRGREVPHSNLKPSRSQASRSRVLDALVLAESVMALLPEDSSSVAKMRGYYDQMREKDYLKKIQSLQFKFLNFEIPTHSSDWLNFLRLYVLTSASNEPRYVRALERLFRSQRDEHNPLFTVIYLAMVPGPDDSGLSVELHETLASFPLHLTNAELLNSGDPSVKKKLFPPFMKNKWIPEAMEPLPIYRRAFDDHEWKNNPFRLDGHYNKGGNVEYPGVDYLLAYWMARRYGLIAADQ